MLFHGIGTPGRALDPGEAPFWVTKDRFLEILDDLATWPDTKISFDDSNVSDLDIALPALQERGLRADFFVIVGRLGQPGSLSADEVRELARQGMTIGSHGLHHRPWRGLDPATTEEEFGRAREQLGRRGVHPDRARRLHWVRTTAAASRPFASTATRGSTPVTGARPDPVRFCSRATACATTTHRHRCASTSSAAAPPPDRPAP